MPSLGRRVMLYSKRRMMFLFGRKLEGMGPEDIKRAVSERYAKVAASPRACLTSRSAGGTPYAR